MSFDVTALDTAVGRFPWMLLQLRLEFSMRLVLEYAPAILAEYRRILEQERGR